MAYVNVGGEGDGAHYVWKDDGGPVPVNVAAIRAAEQGPAAIAALNQSLAAHQQSLTTGRWTEADLRAQFNAAGWTGNSFEALYGQYRQPDGTYQTPGMKRSAFDEWFDSMFVGLLAGGVAAIGALGIGAAAAGAGDAVLGASTFAEVGVAELGLVADAATATAAINAGVPASLLSGGPGALTLAGGAVVDISGMGIQELGLVADQATAQAAINAGIPAELLAGGPNALTLANLPLTPNAPSVPGTNAPSVPGAPGAPGAIQKALSALASGAVGLAKSLLGKSTDEEIALGAAPAAQSSLLPLVLLAGGAYLATRS